MQYLTPEITNVKLQVAISQNVVPYRISDFYFVRFSSSTCSTISLPCAFPSVVAPTHFIQRAWSWAGVVGSQLCVLSLGRCIRAWSGLWHNEWHTFHEASFCLAWPVNHWAKRLWSRWAKSVESWAAVSFQKLSIYVCGRTTSSEDAEGFGI